MCVTVHPVTLLTVSARANANEGEIYDRSRGRANTLAPVFTGLYVLLVHVLLSCSLLCTLVLSIEKHMPIQNQPLSQRDAISRMRTLSEANIPFSFGYFSYSGQLKTGGVYKEVKAAVLRSGYREDQSDLHNVLIAYTDLKNEGDRHFYYCLLATFNGNKVNP